jgi:hypothetical protein
MSRFREERERILPCKKAVFYSIDSALAFLALVMILHLHSYLGGKIIDGAATDALRFEGQARAISVSDYIVALGGAQKSEGELEWQAAAKANVIDGEELEDAIAELENRGLKVRVTIAWMEDEMASMGAPDSSFGSSVCANRIVMCDNRNICRLTVCVV